MSIYIYFEIRNTSFYIVFKSCRCCIFAVARSASLRPRSGGVVVVIMMGSGALQAGGDENDEKHS
jgi:hypothetical protein